MQRQRNGKPFPEKKNKHGKSPRGVMRVLLRLLRVSGRVLVLVSVLSCPVLSCLPPPPPILLLPGYFVKLVPVCNVDLVTTPTCGKLTS